MAGKNSTNIAGLVDGVAEIARANAVEINGKGVSVEDVLAPSEAGKADALQKRGVQEQKIRESEDATEVYETACNETYDSISSACDLFAGAVGKTTPLGKQILAVRSDWRKQGKARTSPAASAKATKKTMVLSDIAT